MTPRHPAPPPASTPPDRQGRAWWLVCIGLSALIWAACWWNWTWRLDQAVYDAAQSTWQRPTSPDIVIVAIDDASIQAIGRWPWKRAIHASVLQQIQSAQPRSVLMDLLLSEPDADPVQDAVLAEALRQSGKVILPVSHVLDASGQGHELRPIPVFQNAVRLAHADAAVDADGTLRRAYLWAGTGAHLYPHPALAMLDAAGEWPANVPRQSGEAQPLPASYWQRQAPMLIRFMGSPGRIAQVSYAAVLRGEVPASAFRHRHVLIGVTARGLGEAFQTPASQLGEGMWGVEVIAQFLDALRQGQGIHALPQAANALLSSVLVLGLLWHYRRVTPRQGLVSSAGVALGALLVSWGLMHWGLWWPPFGLALGALLSYPVWSWRKLEATAQDLEQELQRMASDATMDGPDHRARSPAAPASPRAKADFMRQRTDALSEAGAQLRQTRQWLAQTLAALPDAVFLVNSDQLITQANQQACAMTGVEHTTALLGRRLGEVLAPWIPTEAPNWDMLLDQARLARTPVTSAAAHPRGKQYLVALVQAGDATADTGTIVCATDVTALREAELQRTELLGFIAHDIRSPQASLISLVELHRIGGKMSLEETLQHVDAMARHTLDLCEELLQVMRAETRPIARTQGDLIQLAQDCIDDMQLQARTKDMSLVGNWPPGHMQMATFDDYLLHRAMVNLLSNAIKFSPKGGTVSVSVTREPRHHVIAVRDQGPGIPESELGRLFKRYERVEQGRPSKLAAGIGLGLVFIDTVARRHGGHVKVVNSPGEGACFELHLPLDAAAD